MAELGERARRLLAARPDVIEVRPFGSLARGEAHPGSDADLFVLLRDASVPFGERIVPISKYFTGTGIGCDVLAYTEGELARASEQGDRFARVLEEQSVILARRDEA